MGNPFELLDNRLRNIEALLIDLKEERQNLGEMPPEQPKLESPLNVPQAAEFLSLAIPTIYGLVQRNEIPYMRRSKRIYFSKEALIEWLQNGRTNKARTE